MKAHAVFVSKVPQDCMFLTLQTNMAMSLRPVQAWQGNRLCLLFYRVFILHPVRSQTLLITATVRVALCPIMSLFLSSWVNSSPWTDVSSVLPLASVESN